MEDTEFEIFHGDTLTNEWDTLRELNPAKKPSFDAIVANPPFSYRWEPTDAMGDDVRFKNHGLAPKVRRRDFVDEVMSVAGGLRNLRVATRQPLAV